MEEDRYIAVVTEHVSERTWAAKFGTRIELETWRNSHWAYAAGEWDVELLPVHPAE